MAVEFLEKRPELGEVKNELNLKLSEGQYKALVDTFSNDKEVKKGAAKPLQKKTKERKSAAEHRGGAVMKAEHQQYKSVGKADFDQLNKPVAKKAAVPVENKPTPAAATKPAEEEKKVKKHDASKKPIVDKGEAKPVASKVEKSVEVKVEPKKNETPVAKTEVKVEPKVQTESAATNTPAEPTITEEKRDNGLLQTKNGKKILNTPKVNISGRADLSTLDQSTRPEKKNKEERRKGREEKAGQSDGQGKKKRVRTNKECVDISVAANQQQNRDGKKGNSHNGGGNKNAGEKNRDRNQKPLEIGDEAVVRQVKETLARLASKSQNKKGAKHRKEKRDVVQGRLNAEAKAERKESKILKLAEFVTVSELTTMMNVPMTNIISTLMSVGIMVPISQHLDTEAVNLVADEFDFKTEYISAGVQGTANEEEDDKNDLISRTPIVTVMGHVDHGKTFLLDHIRNMNVIAGGTGGITQHAGAYGVTLEDERKVTSLDTSGHEASTAMRACGAQTTDTAIIIIAADGSVMFVTKGAIAHAQAAGAPVVFTINKIDKPGVNPDKTHRDLSRMSLLAEERGGKYQCQEISAKKGVRVNELLDKVLFEADMMDLGANLSRKATGTIIESLFDKGCGYVNTVLVSNGTLKTGDSIIAGTSQGRIKAMFNECNQRIESAGLAEPIIILGLNGVSTAGDTFHVMETEQETREIANRHEQPQCEQGLRTRTRLTLSDVLHRIARGEFYEMNIIVKGDTDGSIEALPDSFIKLSIGKVNVNAISKAVGRISKSDVMLASASDTVTAGFQVRPSANAYHLADHKGVEINTYSITYDAIDDAKSTMMSMLDKVKEEIVTGQLEIKQVSKISKVGTVADGMVTEGKVHSKGEGRVVRDGVVIHTASIDVLKHYRNDVKEVVTGFECGIPLANYNDLQVGDIIETFMEIKVEQKL